MAGTTTVKRYIKEVARRARGERPVPLDQPLVTTSGRLSEHVHRAAAHAHMGTDIPPEARLRPVKNAMATVARMFTAYQVEFNTAVVDALADIDTALADAPNADKGAAALASLEVYAQDLGDRIEELSRANDQLRVELAAARSEIADARAETEVLRSVLDAARADTNHS